jgi:UDP-N-acetylmuramate--alanine ligase
MPEFIEKTTNQNVTDIMDAQKIFLYGIHGCGMLALAQWFLDKGVAVAGFDDFQGLPFDQRITFGPTIDDVDLLCLTTALPKTHPFYQQLNDFHGAIWQRPALLKSIADRYNTIAVTGTHGKTTTSSLISFLLDKLNYQHHYLIGGCRIDEQRYGSYRNDAQALVFEADESNNSLAHYKAFIAVVLNAHSDHLENFEYSVEQYYENIRRFAQEARWLVIDKVTYFKLGLDATIQQDNVVLIDHHDIIFPTREKHSWQVQNELLPLYLRTPMSWQHIGAALAVCALLGFNMHEAINNLNNFAGVSYRLEHLPLKTSPYVWRDYGHHPNELKNVFNTLSDAYPDFKKIIVFQPHKYSRTKMFLQEFVAILACYDCVYLLPTYDAYEPFDSEGDVHVLHSRLPKSVLIDKVTQDLFNELDDRSLLIFQGAGSIMASALALTRIEYPCTL